MLTPRWIIAFTGHRELANEAPVREALRSALRELNDRITRQGGQAELYSSIAAGSDVLCVEVARELQLPVHLILPLEEDAFAGTFESGWDRSMRQIEAIRAAGGTVRIANADRKPPACYFDTGTQMLEACDVLVAVWDGQLAQGTGGTAEIVELARNLKKPLVWIHAQTGKREYTDFPDNDPERIPDAWPPADPIISRLTTLATETPLACPANATGVEHLETCLGEIAEKEAATFRPGVVWQILLHGFAALIAAWAAVRPHEALTSVELVLVLGALCVLVLLERRRAHPRWLESRFATELLRGLRCSVPIVDPLHPLIAHHMPEWRRFAVSASLLANTSRPAEMSDEKWKSTYTTDRLEDQIRHFREKSAGARKVWRASRHVAESCAWSAPIFVALSLLNKLFHWQWQDTAIGTLIVVWLPIALPLIAGAAAGVRSALDAGRRHERYPQMIERLEEAKRWLKGARTTTSIRNTIVRTEEILLDELVEWYVAAHNTGAH